MHRSTITRTCPYKGKARHRDRHHPTLEEPRGTDENRVPKDSPSAGLQVSKYTLTRRKDRAQEYVCMCDLSHNLDSDTVKPVQKYKHDDQVYNKNDYDINGRPRYRRYWVCCIAYHEKTRQYWYKLKDGPKPHGRTVNWVCERMVAEWNF